MLITAHIHTTGGDIKEGIIRVDELKNKVETHWFGNFATRIDRTLLSRPQPARAAADASPAARPPGHGRRHAAHVLVGLVLRHGLRHRGVEGARPLFESVPLA